MSASILLSMMAASLAIPQSSSAFADAATAMRDSEGVVVVKLFVAPDRIVEDCRVVSPGVTTGDRERVCKKLIGRRASKSALGPDGQAAYGTMDYVVGEKGVTDFTTGTADGNGSRPVDVVLDVQALPGGASSKSVSLNLLLDPAGKVAQCEAADVSSGNFVKAACASFGEQLLEVRKDATGNPVAYVENVTVAFVTRQAAR